LIQAAKRKYDLILFDSPPILSVSDGLIIGKLVEGVILIARAGKTPYEVFEKGQRTLENIGVKIIGVALNAVEINKANSYYYYNHYYGSYYQEDDGDSPGIGSKEDRANIKIQTRIKAIIDRVKTSVTLNPKKRSGRA
jgi:Mrp family chromosome partitioning ATPase